MKQPVIDDPVQPVALPPDSSSRTRLLLFGGFMALLALGFSSTLVHLWRLALNFQEELYSYILLVPCISAYFIWQEYGESVRSGRSFRPFGTSLGPAIFASACAILSLFLARQFGGGLSLIDRTAAQMFVFFFAAAAGLFFFLGSGVVRRLFFPLAFLLFAIPLPTILLNAIEVGLQYASAEAAYWMLSAAQVPLFRDGLIFRLPGIVIRVAQECSGFRSTWVLFMVSLIASHLFLKTRWKKALFTLLIIPLAILRNGFRITTISLLCVHLDPKWIDSPLHHRGGPLFFALSLIPFTLVLLFLWRTDQKSQKKA